jgi:muramoyltetrapeptide carboxypeptidase
MNEAARPPSPRLPPSLRRGDTVAVFAGSSPFSRTLVFRGMGFLHERYRVLFRPDLFAKQGYLAGDDRRRRDELNQFFAAEDVRAVVAARGGYGLSRILDDLDFEAISRTPRWIVGFSDVTALHVEAARRGFASVHGGNVASLGLGDAAAREQWIDTLEDPTRERRFANLDVVQKGTAEGVLFGGNLTLLHAAAAAGKLQVPPRCILFLEDVTERPYRIDRMLTTLASAGHFRGVRGVLLGTFTGCSPGPDGVSVDDLFAQFAARFGWPMVRSNRFGHGRHNDALVLGLPARIEADGAEGSFVVGGRELF